jgi:hypothetical protein
LKLNISAGEFFDLIRPAALIISALLSTAVLASARKNRFTWPITAVWALGSLFFPLIVFPLYLSVLWIRNGGQPFTPSVQDTREKFAIPLLYAFVVLSLTGLYLFRDYRSLDAHLARAKQARVANKRGTTIKEYQAALRIEDNPHTHKLLGIELAESGDFTGALSEFRRAEEAGEPDDSIPFRIGILLDALNHRQEADLEYQRFLNSKACTEPLQDYRCEAARNRLQSKSSGKLD